MSANAARRTRRAPTAEPDSSPAATATGDQPAPRPTRRRSSPSSRVVSFPEPTIQTSTHTPTTFTPAPLAAVPDAAPAHEPPPVPAEQPANLLPSDRRSLSLPAVLSPSSYRSSSVAQLAIGEIDQTLFDCPSCRRPLALGARRCPGCGSLLVRSVLLRKAATFVAVGALAGGLLGLGGGLAMGGALAGAAAVGTPTAASPSDAPVASAAPTQAASPTPPATAVPATPAPTAPPPVGLPFVVRSAFVQLLAVDDRFAGAESELRAALAAPTFDATAVATTLRGVSAQTIFASQLADQVAAWPGAGPLGPTVVDYYSRLHDTAAAALDNSVRNTKAYQTAARQVAELLKNRAAIDAAIRAAGSAAGDALAPTP